MELRDPYRWMEDDPNRELEPWMRAQTQHTMRVLTTAPGRVALKKRMVEMFAERTSYGTPRKHGRRIFYTKLAAGTERSVLMVRDDESERVLVDPTELFGPEASMDSYSVSDDGSMVAFNLSASGAELAEIQIVDVATGAILEDRISNIWGQIPASWTPDGKGLYYTQMRGQSELVEDDKIQGMRAKFHSLGSPVSGDTILLEAGSSTTFPLAMREAPIVSSVPGNRWVVARAVGARSEFRLAVTNETASGHWDLVAEYDDSIVDYAVDGDTLYLLSQREQSNGELLALDLPLQPGGTRVLVPARDDAILSGIEAVQGGVFLKYVRDGASQLVFRHSETGQTSNIELPFVGSLAGLRSSAQSDSITFSLSGWTQATRFFEVQADAPTTLSELSNRDSEIPNLRDIVVRKHSVPGTDGAAIPVTLLHLRDQAPTEDTPAILYGYAGYGATIEPRLRPTFLAWVESGGLLAFAHVRGSGAKGRAWHHAGKGPNKPQGIRDFVSAAEYLAGEKLSSAKRITAMGGSMGGILIGRALTESPEAFGAGVISVGLLNPVRLLESQNGANQISELGDPRIEDGFRAIYEMDSYHNLAAGKSYPSMMILTGANDNRVEPWGPAKFAAKLQHVDPENPALLRVDFDAGHGVGGSTAQAINENVDMFSFARKYSQD